MLKKVKLDHVPTALVTGASAGIGACFAKYLAAQGYHLLLVARRRERLDALALELTAQYGIHCHVFACDLTQADAAAQIMQFAQQQNIQIDILINNAGLSGQYTFADSDWMTLQAELQLMITTLTALCHHVLPHMRAQHWGRIINVSSIAALSPPGASLLYTGIKSYVLNMSQSLDMELKPQGIHVTALCPGFTHSEFHDVMGTRDAANHLPQVLWQQPEAVVSEAWQAVSQGRPVCVPGLVNKFLVSGMRPLPLKLQYLLGNRLNPFK